MQHVLLHIYTPANMTNVAKIFSEIFYIQNLSKIKDNQPQTNFVSFYEKRSVMLSVIAC